MNILLGLMGVDIGGAETHVVTLAEALKAKGHKVVVVSGGGIYEEALKANNIPHVYAPLGQKKPMAVLKSIGVMKQVIKNHEIEIIHTHGRIPSLIGGLVSKITGAKFMTTVHAMYKLNSYKWLTLFGKETICISDDVRRHVIEHYNVSKKQITIIPNCIDIKKFSPVKKEDDGVFTVGYISRMEGMLAERVVHVSRMLSSYAYDNDISLRLLIVGDGPEFKNVVAQINQLSKKLGDQYDSKKIEIQLLGKRTDIPVLMNQMDTVVCVSRVAMEAMSCAKPVILLGGEGYEGLLTQSNYPHAKGSNFTGRTSQMIFEENSFIKIIDELYQSKDLREELGRWGREQIINEFSIGEIVNETLKVYKML